MKHTKAGIIFCCFFIITHFAPFSVIAQENSKISTYNNSRANSLLQKAFNEEGAHKLDEAIKTYKQILKIIPSDPETLNSIAGLYGKKRNFKKEIYWSQKAIRSDSTYYRAYINYGNALTLKNRVKKAVTIYEKAIKIQPNKPMGYYSLGVLAENLHSLKLAISFYKKSVEVAPNFVNGYYNLAAMYANAGKFDKAIAALKQVLKLDPNAKEAKEMIKRIKRDQNNNDGQ